MTGSRSEPAVASDQCRAEFFGKRDIGRVIGGKIVTMLPNPGQQHEVRISGDPEVCKITNRFIGAAC